MGDDIVIGPIRDADTGEITTPASETGEGDGSNDLGAENYDGDNINSYDSENNTSSDTDDFSNVDTGNDNSGGNNESSDNSSGSNTDTKKASEREGIENPGVKGTAWENRDKNNAKVVASEPSGSSQAELTESDTTKKNGKILDEDQVIKENETNTGEQENFKQIEKQLKQVAKEDRGRKGRQAGNALQALKKAQKKGQAQIIQTQDQLKILSKRKKQNQNTPPSVGDRTLGTGNSQKNKKRDNQNQSVSLFGETLLSEQDFERASQQPSNQLQDLREKIQRNPDLGLQTINLLEARNSPTNKQQREKDPVPFNPAAFLNPGRSDKIQSIKQESNKGDGADFSDLKNLPSIVLGDKEFGETNQADNFNFTDVKQTANTAEKLNLSEGELRTLVGQETSQKFSDDVTDAINPEENPTTQFLGKGFAGLSSRGSEAFQAATTSQTYNRSQAATITEKQRDEFSQVIGDVIGEAAALPFQAQVRGGQAQQLQSGELKPGTAGAAAVLSGQKSINYIQKNPGKAFTAAGAGFLLGGPTSLSKTSSIAGDTKTRALNSLTGKKPSESEFIDSGSKVLGTDFEGTASSPPKQSDIPSEEKLPDLGEQAVGREITGVQQEPQSQILGQNLQEEQLSQPETGRTGGVPKDQSGFYDEEIEVLRQRRERKPGVENVESDIRGFSDSKSGKPSADKVAFEQQGKEVLVEETFDASNYMGVGLRGPKVKVTRPEVDPDTDPIDDQIRSGRVEGETDGPKIIEDRTPSRSRNLIDNGRDRTDFNKPEPDTQIDNALGLAAGLNQGQGTDPLLEQNQGQGQKQGQNQGQEPFQKQFEDVFQEQGQDQEQTQDSGLPGDENIEFFRRNNDDNILRDDNDRNRRRDRDRDLGLESQQEENKKGDLAGLVSDQKGFERTTSVGAELLGLKDKDGETKLSAGNPLNLRPELK